MLARQLRTARSFLRMGAIAAVAYRGEVIAWLLSTTMPLIMIALFGAVAREAPLGHYDEAHIVGYFLATFIVRNLTASWISWRINLDIRDGSLGARILLPVHPLVGYAAESAGAVPIRAGVAVLTAAVMLLGLGPEAMTHDPLLWVIWLASIILAWLLSLSVSCTIGGLAFFFESSAKVMDAWLAGLFVFSGYLIPLDLFPARLQGLLDWLPFRYQLGLPVEIMVGAHGRGEAAALLGRQLGFVLLAASLTAAVWSRGLRRFAAYGG